jgi:hypothetical protein
MEKVETEQTGAAIRQSLTAPDEVNNFDLVTFA